LEKNDKIYEGLELLPQDLQGWHGNDPVFRQLIDKYNPTTIIEVGTWKGQSAINMAKYCKETNRETVIYCVDTWLGSSEFLTYNKDKGGRGLHHKNGYPNVYYQFLSNVVHNKVQDYIIPLPNTSFVGSRVFEYYNIKGDMIYIDASHEEEAVYQDMGYYLPLVKEGGVLFGDDYAQEQVARGVKRFCEDNNLEFSVVNKMHWVIQR